MSETNIFSVLDTNDLHLMCTKGERRKISRRRRHLLQALLKWDTACFPLIYWLVVLLSKGTFFKKQKPIENNHFHCFLKPSFLLV